MRRILALTLALLLLLTGCGAPDRGSAVPAHDPGAEELALAVSASQPDTASLAPLTGDELTDYLSDVCGIQPEWWTEGAAYTAAGVNAREIIVLRLSQAEDGEAVTAALEAHRQDRLGDFLGYAPDQAALLENGVVAILGGYAALLVCDAPEEAAAALESALGIGASAEPTPDREAFAPFDPPNDHDMTLYDTSAILAAWESGEEDGLSDKDAAVLARCRALFAEHITDGMTDFEKELALHDALVRLEGEWYCVDPTWDDPIGGESVSPNQWDMVHHEYFNVTSDDMRETDHQWDYDNVPEADARRFYWDGTGRLPN